jgi:sec-independent protein translocase protein TatA
MIHLSSVHSGAFPMQNLMFSSLFNHCATLAVGMPGLGEMAVILVVILLLFGNRLPGAMKSLGQSFVAFKKGIKEGEDDGGRQE